MQKIFLKYGNNIKSSEQLTDIIEYTFFCMYTVSQKTSPMFLAITRKSIVGFS